MRHSVAPASPSAVDTHAPATDMFNPTTTFADRWFAQRGWEPLAFQCQVWQLVADERSGLLHSTTGSGKTYAVWFAALNCFHAVTTVHVAKAAPPLTVLWITPMRALAADTLSALQQPLQDMMSPWSIGLRTGDTSARERSRQARALPTVLITTPESLSLLLTNKEAQTVFGHLRMVIVDEWHELLGNKRGVQVQLALARLRHWQPRTVVWGLSATLGNLEQALDVLVPRSNAVAVAGETRKPMLVDTLLPDRIERFPWTGHLGLRMLPYVIREIESSGSTLLFTNTRSQAEMWYQSLLAAKPDWAGAIGLHHGSLDKSTRNWVEKALKSGQMRAVICTSSLDLGVDFAPVERVLQIGSAKGVARLLQRAGRSGHTPGQVSRVTLVPTHSLEILEAAAARLAVQRQWIEPRQAPDKPLDVLVQHLVTVALGGGFLSADLLAEVRTTHAYRDLTDKDWAWALAFVSHGGASLTAYPDYHRIRPDDNGLWTVTNQRLARRHRMSIGTIMSDSSVQVSYWAQRGGGAVLGTVEESFVARLKPGDCFLFAGRQLELVRLHDMTVYVKRASGKRGFVPRWNGGRMPLSTRLASAVLEKLQEAREGCFNGPEMQALQPLLELQDTWSRLPAANALLAEQMCSREGTHLFLYPFAGRSVNFGIAQLLAWRMAVVAPNTFSLSVNDYGFELLALEPVAWTKTLLHSLLNVDNLEHDLRQSLNAGELAQRRFREIARVAGLVFAGYPGSPKSTRQLQASAGLFFEVFRQYDPGNGLLTQAYRDVLHEDIDLPRLRTVLEHLRDQDLGINLIPRPTPFAFPLLVARLRETLSTEQLAARVERMMTDLEGAAGEAVATAADSTLAALKFVGSDPNNAASNRRVKRTNKR